MLVMSQSVIFQSINQVSVNHSVILSRDSQSVKGWSVNQSRVSQSVKGQSVKYHSVTQSISQLVNLSVIHATFRLLALLRCRVILTKVSFGIGSSKKNFFLKESS